MQGTEDIYTTIVEIVRQETTYLRHYYAQVVINTDPEKKGRICVLVPELGWDNPTVAAWPFPRHNGLQIPKVNSWVEIYFMNGDRNRPVYMPIAYEMASMLPKNYNGLPTKQIIYEGLTANDYIIDDQSVGMSLKSTKKLILDGTLIDIGQDATEPLVLGNKLMTYISTLISTINGLFATKVDGSGSPGTLVVPNDILSSFGKTK